MASGATAAMTIALTIYACITKTDFTICGSLFLCLTVGMLILCTVSLLFSFVEWWHPVVAVLLVIFYGLFLIYDTQLIMGKHENRLSYDDYIIGAMIVYIDIIMLFLEILKLLGDKN